MTEEEARTKWCPKMFGWVVQPQHDAVQWQSGCCIGSACMAWREGRAATKSLPVGMTPDEPDWEKDGPEIGIGGATTHRQPWKRRQFYCGLAGQP